MNAENQISPATALRTAAYNADLLIVRHLVREAVDVNVADEWGRTALSLAAGQGHLEIVEFLLENGAWVDPHEDYDTRETPLLAAAGNGYLNVVQVLIAAGANPQLHVGVSQTTAECCARLNGHSEVSNYLRAVMDGPSKAGQ